MKASKKARLVQELNAYINWIWGGHSEHVCMAEQLGPFPVEIEQLRRAAYELVDKWADRDDAQGMK